MTGAHQSLHKSTTPPLQRVAALVKEDYDFIVLPFLKALCIHEKIAWPRAIYFTLLFMWTDRIDPGFYLITKQTR